MYEMRYINKTALPCLTIVYSTQLHYLTQSEFIINKTDNVKEHFCYEPGNSSCIMAMDTSTVHVFLYMLIGSTVSIIIISGNLVLITSIIHFKLLHTPTKYCILSLAAADLLVGTLALLFNMALSVESCLYFGVRVRVRSFDFT